MSLDQLGIADALGIAGFAIYACADTMLALRRLHSDQIRFYLIYATAGCLILLSLSMDFNMGAFLSEAFSLVTCGVAVVLRLSRPRILPIGTLSRRAKVDRGELALTPKLGYRSRGA